MPGIRQPHLATLIRLPGLSRRRRLLAGAAALTVVATPVTIVATTGGASATNPDTIIFTQTTGKTGSYLAFVSGSTGKKTTESVTGGGGCGTPSPTTIMGFGAWVGPSAAAYPDPTTSQPLSGNGAVVGTYNARTGVCTLGQAWSIDNVPAPSSGGSAYGIEALNFSVGPDATNSVDAGRIFSKAQISLARYDTQAGTATVNLVEWLDNTYVGEQTCTIGPTVKTNSPATISADTSAPTGGACTGPVTGGFDTVEIQVPTAGESVAVVQTSTFTLENQICGGDTITATSTDGTTTSGNVSATITFTGSSSDCKSYSGFTASANDPASPNGVNTTASVLFGANSGFLDPGDDLAISIDWGNHTFCAPDSNTNDSVPTCPPTQISFDNGQSYEPQTYCSSATALNDSSIPWCTVSKKFTNVDINGTTYTHIQETWDGVGDPYLRN